MVRDPRYGARMPHDSTPESRRPAPPGATTMTGELGLSELRSGDVLAGRFRIESMLGIGGMGVVYRAYDQSLDVQVAIKLLRPELARRPEAFERFRQELLLARQISSAHVVRIHDIAQHEGRWFISMDFIDGQSLEHLLDQEGNLPTDRVLAITRGLLEGLVAAHQRGVVHRDLKPANILLDTSGHAYITDFGVARSLGNTRMTQTGMIVGTPEYLSPEQARGETVDARSDLYTVGLILYEMLARTLPFSGGTPAETVMQRIVRQPPSLARLRPDLPSWLHALCDRLLKLSPAHRFASAQDTLRALDARRVPRAPLNRRALLYAALVVTAIAGVADWAWRHPLVPAQAPSAVAIPRLVLLPFTAPGGDEELHGLARAFGAHLYAWLRDDRSLGVVPPARMLAALARTAPDAHGDALLRQLPEIAHAANASRIVRGDLRRDAAGLVLELSVLESEKGATANSVIYHGADAPALLAGYSAGAASQLAGANVHPGAAPPLPAPALVPLGRALLALEAHQAQAAADALAPFASASPPNALVDQVLLDAQGAANQPLAVQTTRDAVIKQFAADSSAGARELYVAALSADDQGSTAVTAAKRAVGDYPNDAALAIQAAEVLSANGNGEQALAVLNGALKVDDQNPRIWFLLGRVSIGQGQAQAAVDDYLVRALVLNTRSGDQAAQAQTRNAMGVGYERLGQLDAAAEQYGQSASLWEKLQDEQGLAKTLRNLAIVQAERGDRDAADRSLDRVQALLEKSSDRGSLSDLFNDRGVVAEEHGNFADALKFYRQALALRQQLNLVDKIAESLNNIGFSSYQIGDYDNARAYWQQALAQYQKLDDHNGALHIEQSISLLDIASGHFEQARKRLQDTLQTAEDHQLPEEVAVSHVYLGELDLTEGRLADAANDARSAAQIYARRADSRGEAEVALLQARIALELGDRAGADIALTSLTPEKLDSEQLAELLLTQARSADSGGDTAAAGAKLDAAATAAGEAHSGLLAVRIQLERTRQALAHSQDAQAAKLLVALRGDTTRLGEVPLRLDLLELQTAGDLRSGHAAQAIAHYHDALGLLRACGRFRDAVFIHELGALALGANASEAAVAHTSADAARAQLLNDAPADVRTGLQEQLQKRLREESRGPHGS
jgi:eukaryotic-like serine/threonine-protein kinase